MTRRNRYWVLAAVVVIAIVLITTLTGSRDAAFQTPRQVVRAITSRGLHCRLLAPLKEDLPQFASCLLTRDEKLVVRLFEDSDSAHEYWQASESLICGSHRSGGVFLQASNAIIGLPTSTFANRVRAKLQSWDVTTLGC